MSKFYITTPLYYVNASPHIGHAYTNIAADSLARYMRKQLGEENVWFLTGTDEHGQKIKKAAQERQVLPKKFADSMADLFKSLWKKLDISHNDFIRTTEARHVDFVKQALKILYENGDIYQAKYEGWYCVPCETFWPATQVENFSCPECKRGVDMITEECFYFRLKKYQDWLLKYIQDNPEFIRPEIRRHEMLSFLKLNELEDLCISRPKERMDWGITLPFSPEHVTYVWFDALLNYISAVGEFDGKNYKSKWWPADLQLIGKDILRQHTVYWPIILRALGIEPPKTVFAHGWWLIGEDKMSKSRGNVVSPFDVADKFGTDVLRYFLLRDVPFGMDGHFSEEAIIKRFNGDLANDLGNLVYRTLNMIEKYYQGSIPAAKGLEDDKGRRIAEKIDCLLSKEVAANLTSGLDYNFSLGLERIWELVNMANKYVEERKPWTLAKNNQVEELKEFIALLVRAIRCAAVQLYPFMPATSRLILEQFGQDSIVKGAPLFPRIEIK